jgi:hypothetical protein
MTTSRWHSSESPIDGHALVALLAPVARTSSSLWPLGFARLSIEESTGDGFLQAAHEIAEIGTFSQFGQLPNLDALFSDH